MIVTLSAINYFKALMLYRRVMRTCQLTAEKTAFGVKLTIERPIFHLNQTMPLSDGLKLIAATLKLTIEKTTMS
jgi:hypothetical protein